MSSVGRSFNEVSDYVNKVERVMRDRQARALAKRENNFRIFKSLMIEYPVDLYSRPSLLNMPGPPLPVTIWEHLLIIFQQIRMSSKWQV